MADTFVVISNLVFTNLQFLVCFVLFFRVVLCNDLDDCVSTGVSPVSIIGNSYTLITNYAHTQNAGMGLVQTQTDRKGR